MIPNLVVEPFNSDFVLWRCVHDGPLTRENIDVGWSDAEELPWEALRARNLPFLTKLRETYGAYAIVARHDGQVIGHLRFYPKAVCAMSCSFGMCIQQQYPGGPADDFADEDFPPLDQIQDRTLIVHCMMSGAPIPAENKHHREGIGTRMALCLIEWAKGKGWRAIEATAFEDLEMIYEFTGAAGRHFWEKLGFKVVATEIEPAFDQESDLVDNMREQALQCGIDPAAVRNRYTMRLEWV